MSVDLGFWYDYNDADAYERVKALQAQSHAARCRRWPALADPAPPKPPTDTDDGRTFEEVWFDLVEQWRAGTYQLPRSGCLDGLVGPTKPHGYCLDPLFRRVRWIWYDPRRAARSGDFVVVLPDAARIQNNQESEADDPRFARTYPPEKAATSTVIKLLYAARGRYWCLANEGTCHPLATCQVLGVIVHTEEW